mmetsp:Transcript_21574/g.59813  ORF Transcript_21574/g.59813 Transcript_21574/m.59813 type:complete len:91 (-) Transcript_21574:138-410(-)
MTSLNEAKSFLGCLCWTRVYGWCCKSLACCASGIPADSHGDSMGERCIQELESRFEKMRHQMRLFVCVGANPPHEDDAQRLAGGPHSSPV